MTIFDNVYSEAKPRRSLLFVPGSRLEMLPKAFATATDIVCIDLEDAVAQKQKLSVRKRVISFIQKQLSDKPHTDKEIWIRINTIRSTDGLEDIIAIARADTAPDGIMIPKIHTPEEIKILRDTLSIKHKDLEFHPLIETTLGLKFAFDIAKSSHKIGSLVFGGFDMSANLNVEPSWDALLFSRHTLVLAAANAKIDLLDMPHFGLTDLIGLEEESRKAFKIGFSGKCSIHPKQIDIINKVFSPSSEQVSEAKDLIEKYEAQNEAFVEINGVMMEKPVVERLNHIIAIDKKINHKN